MSVIDELFLRHAGKALEQQMVLSDAIGTERWSLDLGNGLLRFGQRGLSIQLLAATSSVENTWTWAWAHAGLSKHTLLAAEHLRQLGEEHGIPELTHRSLSLDDIDPARLAIVCTGLTNAQGHFVAPYPEESLYLLIIDPLFPVEVEATAPLAALIVGKLGTAFPGIDQPAAAKAWLQSHGVDYDDDGSTLTATFDDDTKMVAEYDGSEIVATWNE